MTKVLFATVLIAGIATAAQAQWPAPVERALTRQYNDCMARDAAAQGVNPAMMRCSGEELDRQDARLNQAYRMTLQRLSPARKARLRNDERAWIARRDRSCRREAGSEGTAAALNFSQCMLRETIARRLWLERYR